MGNNTWDAEKCPPKPVKRRWRTSKNDELDYFAAQATRGIYPHCLASDGNAFVYRMRRPGDLSTKVKTIFHYLGNERMEIYFYQ